MEEHTLN